MGTCLVQVPDSDGRWQPVKISASMQGSPVGSRHGSLAPSESTVYHSPAPKLRGAPSVHSVPEEDDKNSDWESMPGY